MARNTIEETILGVKNVPRGIYIRTAAMRESIRQARLGTHASEETKAKLRIIRRQESNDPNWIKKVSNKTREAMKRPEIKKRHIVAVHKAQRKHGFNFKGGKGQKAVAFVESLSEVLTPAGFIREYPVGKGKGNHGYFSLDFAHVEGKICIECDGPKHKSVRQREFDYQRDAFLKLLGWRVIRVKHD